MSDDDCGCCHHDGQLYTCNACVARDTAALSAAHKHKKVLMNELETLRAENVKLFNALQFITKQPLRAEQITKDLDYMGDDVFAKAYDALVLSSREALAQSPKSQAPIKLTEPPGQEWFRKWEKELDISEKLRMEKSDLARVIEKLCVGLENIATCCNCTELCTCSEWAIDKAKETLAEAKRKAGLE